MRREKGFGAAARWIFPSCLTDLLSCWWINQNLAEQFPAGYIFLIQYLCEQAGERASERRIMQPASQPSMLQNKKANEQEKDINNSTLVVKNCGKSLRCDSRSVIYVPTTSLRKTTAAAAVLGYAAMQIKFVSMMWVGTICCLQKNIFSCSCTSKLSHKY